MMNPRVTATLDALRRVVWFRSVGGLRSEHTLSVETWDEALDWNGDGAWENVQLEAANRVSEAIHRKSRGRFQSWNAVVEDARPIVTSLVEEKTRDAVDREGLDKSFVASVRWDILHLAVEAEFADLIAPGFFAQLGYWYERGHWPCGWEGSMDSGRLVVF